MGIRPDRVASLIQRELAPILSEAGKQLLDGSFLTLMEVEVTPDLSLAKAYLSLYNSKDKNADLNIIEENTPVIKKYLGSALRNHLKKMPDLRFFLDETQDRAERMDELLRKINRSDNPNENEE